MLCRYRNLDGAEALCGKKVSKRSCGGYTVSNMIHGICRIRGRTDSQGRRIYDEKLVVGTGS